MTDIKLGQSIIGSFTSTDNKIADVTSLLNGDYYDEYTISGLDSFRQVNITLDSAPTNSSDLVRVINTDTGAVLASSLGSSGSLPFTTFPGLNYKIQVINNVKNTLGNYTLSLSDGGKATSIVSTDSSVIFSKGLVLGAQVGTVGTNGVYFPLATSLTASSLGDVALAADGQLYAFSPVAGNTYEFLRIDPTVDPKVGAGQIKSLGILKDPLGANLYGDGVLNSLAFGGDNKLYAVGGDDFYQIDVNTSVATLLGDTPKEANFVSSGDLIYDAANQRFLVTAKDTVTGDALWQIPADSLGGLTTENLAKAAKIGQIGFAGVEGINFENGQLVGFSSKGGSNSRIKIDASTGNGTLDIAISSIDGIIPPGISGSSTIFGGNTPPVIVTSPVVITPPIIITPPVVTTPSLVTAPPVVANPPTVIDVVKLDSMAIGNKSQRLAQGRIIDLSEYTGKTLKADITTQGDAAYTNNIGFYVVEDALLGTIKLADGSFLQPSDANYAVEAIKNALTNSLQAGKIDSKLGQDIVGGKLYAPVVIAQGSLSDFVSKNPSNGGGANDIHAYFNYVGGNSDKVDHFKLLGNNTFGVEDMYGGGDRDFNDIVVTMNVKTA